VLTPYLHDLVGGESYVSLGCRGSVLAALGCSRHPEWGCRHQRHRGSDRRLELSLHPRETTIVFHDGDSLFVVEVEGCRIDADRRAGSGRCDYRWCDYRWCDYSIVVVETIFWGSW